MNIRSDHGYRFTGDRQAVWQGIDQVERYPDWWPWLKEFDGRALHAGQVWSCVVRPPLPYAVRFRIHLVEVVAAQHVVATIDGDITGSARLELRDHQDGCDVRLTSDLAPASRFLRRVASVARPVVRFGHDWVIDTGARQFTARFGEDGR